MADNVTTLQIFGKWQFNVFEQKDGVFAEGHRNGELMWEYQGDDMLKVARLMLRSLEND